MVVNSSVDKPPKNDHRKVWRYISFYQLVSIIDKEKLYFSSLDSFDDQFEGSFPKEESIDSRSELYIEDLKDRGAASNPEEFATSVSNYRNQGPKIVFSNCWHINDRETALTWDRYANRSIAIQTTISNLRKVFSTSKKGAYMYEVEYIDYKNDSFQSDHRLAAYFHKRLSFKQENELRLLFLDWPPQSEAEFDEGDIDKEGFDLMAANETTPDMFVKGQFHEVDIEPLIENIYVSPDQGEEFVNLTRSILNKYSVDAQVNQSDLSEEPLY